jgi:hypothetical protein
MWVRASASNARAVLIEARCYHCGLMLLALGCASAGTRKSSSATIANLESSVPELSSRNQSRVAVYSSEIETAADKIILESPPGVRQTRITG